MDKKWLLKPGFFSCIDNGFISIFLVSFLKKNHIKSKVLTDEEREEMAIAKWIDECMESEDVTKEKIYPHMRKHGIKC
jgi:hypothetical protein